LLAVLAEVIRSVFRNQMNSIILFQCYAWISILSVSHKFQYLFGPICCQLLKSLMVLPFLNGTKGLNRLLGFFWLLLLCSPYVCCKISYRHYQYVLWNACCACNTILLLHWSEITQFQVIELSSRSPFKRNGRGQTWWGLSFSIVHTEVRTHSNARVRIEVC